MSDLTRVRSWFDDGVLVPPDAASPNIVDLAQAFAALTGVPDVPLTPSARALASLIGDARHYVFILIDGLGMEMIERQPEGEFFRSRTVMELRTVAPSSTAPALTSLATGLWPAEHAIPGWFTYLPDAGITATILPYVERFSGRDARECGADPSTTFPAPPLIRATTRRQLRVMPRAIADSVYSRYSGGGVESYGYETLTQAIDAIVSNVASSSEPASTYFYVPFVDAEEHASGPQSQETADALGRARARIETLLAQLDGRARVVLTADHGQILVQRDRQVELIDGDPLLALLHFAPSCDSRLPAFHVREHQHAAFESSFRDRFGDTWALLTLDEAEVLQLFGPGPLTFETRRRLGDYVAVCGEREALLYRPSESMLGFHGGLAPDEMRVPLLLA